MENEKPAQPAQPEQAPSEWKNVDEVKKIIAARDEYKKQVETMSQRLSLLEKAEQDREAAAQARREADERRKLEEAGQYQEIIKKNEEKWKGEIAAREKKYSEQIVPLFIKATASAIPNITPEALRDLPFLLRESIRPNADGVPTVYENGLPKLDPETGKPFSPEQFVIDTVKQRSYMLMDTMPVSHGAATGASGKSQPKTFTQMMDEKDNAGLSRLREADPDGFVKALNQYTVEVAQRAKKAAYDKARR